MARASFSSDLNRFRRLPDERSLNLTLRVSAALLWVPHSVVSLYIAFTSDPFDFSNFIFTLVFSLGAIALTFFLAVYQDHGDYLLILSWVLGVLSEDTWLTSSSSASALFQQSPEELALARSRVQSPRLFWIVASMMHGAVGGLLCKIKDIDEDRYYPSHAIGERLYVVVPFCTGQWLRFILKYGWRGIVVETMTILLSLALAGYSMILYKMLRQHTSLAGGDIIGLISEILTTSFGVVFLTLFFGNIFVTSLAIPFLKSLFSLNALVSSMGIILELLVYEVA